MFKKQLHNEDGVILITVLVIVIVLTLLTISIYSLNTSQAILAEEEIRRVQGELIAEGEHIRYFGSQQTVTAYSPSSYVVDGMPFAVSETVTPGGPGNSSTITLDISF